MHPVQSRSFSLSIASGTPSNSAHRGSLIKATQHTNTIFHPAHVAGFSFALHLLRVQGFYFAQMQYSPIQAFTARFVTYMQLYHPRHKTAHRALQWRLLRYVPFYSRKYQTNTRGYNTVCDTLERAHAPGRPSPIPEPPPRRTLYRPAQPHTMQARRGSSYRMRIVGKRYPRRTC